MVEKFWGSTVMGVIFLFLVIKRVVGYFGLYLEGESEDRS